jgi:hypothetical protein
MLSMCYIKYQVAVWLKFNKAQIPVPVNILGNGPHSTYYTVCVVIKCTAVMHTSITAMDWCWLNLSYESYYG